MAEGDSLVQDAEVGRDGEHAASLQALEVALEVEQPYAGLLEPVLWLMADGPGTAVRLEHCGGYVGREIWVKEVRGVDNKGTGSGERGEL